MSWGGRGKGSVELSFLSGEGRRDGDKGSVALPPPGGSFH